MSRRDNKRSVTPNLEDRQQNEYRRVLEDLLRLDENKLCADCKKTGPKWASVTLGIFLCLDCAGLHRNLGVHISFIRSTSLDTWKAEQIEAMKNMGNRKSNEIFEANLSSDFPKPNPGDKIALGNWIRTKYVDKSFARKNEAGRSQRNPNQGNASQPITRRENENFSVKKKEIEEFDPFNRTTTQNHSSPLILGPTNNMPDLFSVPTQINVIHNQVNVNVVKQENSIQNKPNLVDNFMKMFEEQNQIKPNTPVNTIPNLFGNNQQGNANNQQGFSNGQQFGNNQQGFGNGQFVNQGYGNNQQGFSNGQQQFGNNQQGFNNGFNNGQFNQGNGNNQQGFSNGQQQFGNNQQGFGQFNQGNGNNQQGFGNGQQQFGNQGHGNNKPQMNNNGQFVNQGFGNNQQVHNQQGLFSNGNNQQGFSNGQQQFGNQGYGNNSQQNQGGNSFQVPNRQVTQQTTVTQSYGNPNNQLNSTGNGSYTSLFD